MTPRRDGSSGAPPRRPARGLAAALAVAVLPGCDVGTSPEVEQVPGLLVVATDELGARWAWTGAREIAYLTAGGASLQAVDVETGATRPLVPAGGAATIGTVQPVAPYLYYDQDGGLHRVPVAGGATERLADLPAGLSWSVSADHAWLVWADGDALVRESLADGTRDTVLTAASNAGHRVFAAPDGAAAVAVEWGRWPGRMARVDFGGAEVTGRTPCPVEDGSVVAWESGVPALYAACPDTFIRQPVAGDSSRLATIGGGRDGTWSPDLGRVSAWRRSCPRWSSTACPEAERELWIAEVGGTPQRVATIVLDARQTLDDGGPAYFAPDGARVAFRLEAGSVHDGLRVLRID